MKEKKQHITETHKTAWYWTAESEALKNKKTQEYTAEAVKKKHGVPK